MSETVFVSSLLRYGGWVSPTLNKHESYRIFPGAHSVGFSGHKKRQTSQGWNGLPERVFQPEDARLSALTDWGVWPNKRISFPNAPP